MDIHKPKPWHGFREFLKEYFIIVVGVLTALAGEQVVENLHWSHVLNEERAALRSELADLQGSIQARRDIQPCIEARLLAVRTLIARHDAGQDLGLTGPIGRPVYYFPTTGTWEMAVADQSMARMPFPERRRYLAAYSRYNAYNRNVADERSAWRELQLINQGKALSPADWSRVREAYEQAQEIFVVLDSREHWFGPFEAFGKPAAVSVKDSPMVKTFCAPFMR